MPLYNTHRYFAGETGCMGDFLTSKFEIWRERPSLLLFADSFMVRQVVVTGVCHSLKLIFTDTLTVADAELNTKPTRR